MRNRLSRILAMAVALVLALPGFSVWIGAAERNMTTVFTTNYTKPEVKVIVPTTGAVFINPYEESVKIGSEDEAGQILSIPSGIANLSLMPLQVDATVSAVVKEGSDMYLSSSSTKDMITSAKRAFMYFEMKTVNAAQAADPDSVRWDGEYNEETDLVVRTVPRTKKKIVTLAAATRDGDITDNGAAFFHLGGDAVKNPKSAWSEKDGVQVTVSFRFTPLPLS